MWVSKLPKLVLSHIFFAENRMKMKEFGPPPTGEASMAPHFASANGDSRGSSINRTISVPTSHIDEACEE